MAVDADTPKLTPQQRWKNANREHVRQRDRGYRDKTKVRRNELERKRYALNPQKFISKTKKYYWEHAEEMKRRSNTYYHHAYLNEEVRKKAQERTKQWASDNPERAARNAKVSKHKRRALELKAEGSFTAMDVADIMKAQRGKCAYCRKSLKNGYHVDHIVALINGGANHRRNLQLLCPPCNMSKHTSDPLDHARTLGMLL